MMYAAVTAKSSAARATTAVGPAVEVADWPSVPAVAATRDMQCVSVVNVCVIMFVNRLYSVFCDINIRE